MQDCSGCCDVLLRSPSSGPRHSLTSQVPGEPSSEKGCNPSLGAVPAMTDQQRSTKAWCPSVNSGQLWRAIPVSELPVTEVSVTTLAQFILSLWEILIPHYLIGAISKGIPHKTSCMPTPSSVSQETWLNTLCTSSTTLVNVKLFPRWLYQLAFLPTAPESSTCLIPLPNSSIIWFFIFSQFSGHKMEAHCGFNSHFSGDYWGLAPFQGFVGHLDSLFGNSPSSSAGPILWAHSFHAA